MNGSQYTASNANVAPLLSGALGTVGHAAGSYFLGYVPEVAVYNTGLSGVGRNLVEQYQSAKWGIALTPPGTGSTEVQKATAADGYSVFTTRYLERLSQSADISLQATNSITLDLKGDTLALGNDRSLSLTTTNGNISSVSAGTITTNRTTTGGNITLTAGGAGTITLSDFGLNATNGGRVNLAAGGAVNVVSPTALNLGTVSGTGVTLRTTEATADLTIASGGSITATNTSGDGLVLAAGRNFLNLAGSSALSTTGTARWLVYSTDPASDTTGGLTNDFRRFSCTYGGSCPVLGSGNGFLYSTSPTLIAMPSVVNITAGSTPNLTGYGYSLTGYLGSDASADIIGGSLNGSTPYVSGDPIGTYALNYASGILTSSLGYAFAYAGNPTGIVVAALPSGGGGAATPLPIMPPTAPVPPATGPVTPPGPVALPPPPPISPSVNTSPLPSVVQMTLNQVASQFANSGLPGPQPSTLKTEINGNEIILTPIAGNTTVAARTTENGNTEQGENEPVNVPCASGSPYDPNCHSGANSTVQ